MTISANKITAFQKTHAMLDRKPNAIGGLTYTELQAWWDSSPEELRVAFNALVDALLATTDGASGADNIGATAVSGLTGTTVQTLIESLKTYAETLVVDVQSGSLADNSIAEIKMHASMKKQAGGVLPFDDFSAANVLTKLLTVDGPSSGLNADLLDGLEGAAFQAAIVRGTGTISTSGWVANTGDYPHKLDVAISGVVSANSVHVYIDKDDQDTAQTAGLCAVTEAYDGGVTIFSKAVPGAPMAMSYEVVK